MMIFLSHINIRLTWLCIVEEIAYITGELADRILACGWLADRILACE